MISQTLNWDEAKAYCKELAPYSNGNLASVPDQETSDFLHGTLNKGGGGMWVGGYRHPLEGVWKWTDGTKFDFSNWDIDEPNLPLDNSPAIRSQWHQWQDRKKIQKHYFVCQQACK